MQRTANPRTSVRFRAQPPYFIFQYFPDPAPTRYNGVVCPGGEIGRRKGLKIKLSTQLGNHWREWSQIRGNLSALRRWQSRAKPSRSTTLTARMMSHAAATSGDRSLRLMETGKV